MTNLCPEPQRLLALLNDEISGPEAEILEAHVQVCRACQQALDRITDSPGPGSDKAGPPALPESVSPFLAQLEQHPPTGAADLRSTPLDSVPASNDLSACLAPPQGAGERGRIGSYRLLKVLGVGGMGVVFQAQHVRLGRVVAVKLIRKKYLGNPQAVRRFLREVRAASRLDHPHVVRALDAGQSDDLLYLVMECVEGTDLARLVNEKGPLPVWQACEYIRQAARALAHAHEMGLVHRDVKPSNLLLSSQGTVKLLDLGLARTEPVCEEVASSTITTSRLLLGTPDYVAPEQIRDAHRADIRADLYSLGCTFYYLLTGRAPFAAATVGLKLLQHQNDEPPPLESLRPDVPAAVVGVVRKLVAKDPAARFQTPSELVVALEGLLAGARPGAPGSRLAQEEGMATGTSWRGWFRFGRAGWLVVLALVLGAAAIVWLAVRDVL